MSHGGGFDPHRFRAPPGFLELLGARRGAVRAPEPARRARCSSSRSPSVRSPRRGGSRRPTGSSRARSRPPHSPSRPPHVAHAHAAAPAVAVDARRRASRSRSPCAGASSGRRSPPASPSSLGYAALLLVVPLAILGWATLARTRARGRGTSSRHSSPRARSSLIHPGQLAARRHLARAARRHAQPRSLPSTTTGPASPTSGHLWRGFGPVLLVALLGLGARARPAAAAAPTSCSRPSRSPRSSALLPHARAPGSLTLAARAGARRARRARALPRVGDAPAARRAAHLGRPRRRRADAHGHPRRRAALDRGARPAGRDARRGSVRPDRRRGSTCCAADPARGRPTAAQPRAAARRGDRLRPRHRRRRGSRRARRATATRADARFYAALARREPLVRFDGDEAAQRARGSRCTGCNLFAHDRARPARRAARSPSSWLAGCGADAAKRPDAAPAPACQTRAAWQRLAEPRPCRRPLPDLDADADRRAHRRRLRERRRASGPTGATS